MACIVSRALILFKDPKDKRLSTCNFSAYCCQKSTKKDKIDTFFELKWLIYVEKLSPFPLFVLYACDNLVYILLQLGSFHAHHANQKN